MLMSGVFLEGGMRVAKALIAVATLTLVAGCASAPPPPQAVVAKGPRSAGRVIPCTTTELGVATTASCGGGFNLFSAAGE